MNYVIINILHIAFTYVKKKKNQTFDRIKSNTSQKTCQILCQGMLQNLEQSPFIEAILSFQPTNGWRSIIGARESLEMDRWIIEDSQKAKIQGDIWIPNTNSFQLCIPPLQLASYPTSPSTTCNKRSKSQRELV